MAYIYSASAVGLGAVLTGPAPNAESWAPCCLPIIGGRSASVATGVAWPTSMDPVLRFDLAWTQVTGEKTGQGQYTTTIGISVTNLNILNFIRGDIDVTLTFTYRVDPKNPGDRNRDQVDVAVVSNLVPAEEPYAHITIHGVAVPAIHLNNALYEGAGLNFKNFRAAILGQERRPNEHLDHPHGGAAGHGHGVIWTALAEPRNAPVVYNTPHYGQVIVPNLGSVYFGEWKAEPYRQIFTLLRVVLDNAQDRLNQQGSRFTGEIVIDEEENGRG